MAQIILRWQPAGNAAVKLSTGEAGNEYYLSPDLIKGLVQEVDGTIVECKHFKGHAMGGFGVCCGRWSFSD